MDEDSRGSMKSGSNTRAAIPMPMDGLGQKSAPTVLLDRFRTMVKERDEEVGGIDGDEIVGIYEEVLAELTFNSKPIITDLTIIAGEQRENGQGIANAICSRILEVPVEQKLPSLYLLDSIVKNIGRDYVKHFAARLPEVFCAAYSEVDPSLYSSMRHLFGTWSQVFPSHVLHKIESVLQFSSQESQHSSASTRKSESPSPHHGHGIHINPKYLEARQQLEQSTMAIQRQRGMSSGLDIYKQKDSQYGDSKFDLPEVIGSLTGTMKTGSHLVTSGRASAMVGSEKLHHRLKNPMIMSSSSDVSPRKSDSNGWHKGDVSSFEDTLSAYNPSVEYGKRGPRELIGAYGNNRGQTVLPDRSLKTRRLEDSGISTGEAIRKWKNTEEEEYAWEEMSPTAVNQNISDKMTPYVPNGDRFSTGTSLGKPHPSITDSEFRSKLSTRNQLASDDTALMIDTTSKLLRSHAGSERRALSQYQSSQYSREPWKSEYVPSQSSQQSLSPRLRGRMPLSACGPVPFGQKMSSHGVILDADERSSRVFLDSKNTSVFPSIVMNKPVSLWPAAHNSQSSLPFHILPKHQDFRNPSDSAIVNQGPTQSISLPWQLSDAFDRKTFSSNTPIQMPHQNPGTIPLNLQNLEQNPALQFQHRRQPGRMIPSISANTSHLLAQSINQVPPVGESLLSNSILPNLGVASSSLPMHGVSDSSLHRLGGVSDSSLHQHGGVLPPLPPGPPPIATHTSGSLVSSSSASGFSGLLSSLVSQGLISVQPSTLSKDCIGFEFDPELLKVRHESIVSDLYVNLPRQCTTCGMRFKSQDEHSSHMDWHVTKNRMSKNRKQKPSRKWFVSGKEWLSSAETVGTDAVPGFLPTETVVDKNEEKELAVPADEDQNLCALCGEAFEDFYSDEADEWMYKGAVYMNAPRGSIEGLDRSLLGPIVHAKCRSESTEVQGQS